MTEPTGPPYGSSTPPPAAPPSRPATSGSGLKRFRISAAIVIVVAAGIIVWLAVRDNGNSTSSTSTSTSASAVTEAQIQALATSVGHPVFWVGPKAGLTYELSRTSNGTIYIRYLPSGVSVGSKTPYLTVATYPFPQAYAAIQAVTKLAGITTITLAGKGLAETPVGSSTSVHAAYPNVDYQVEVFDPTAGTAQSLVAAGDLAAIGNLTAGSNSAAKATSLAGLKALAASLGHSIYWAGPKKGYSLELKHTSDGQVFVRYLPAGAAVGASEPYLTIGTYPYPGAFSAIQALSKQASITSIDLAGGGLAVIDKARPTNIHLAYPGSSYQVEVFDPSAAAARQAAGKIQSIG